MARKIILEAIVGSTVHGTAVQDGLEDLDLMAVTRRDGRVAMHGNTKYAGHVVRLGLQGAEILSTGRISLPMSDDERELILKIRTGGFTLAQVSEQIIAAERRLDEAFEHSPLPEQPDAAKVERWMLDTYLEHWSKS